MKFRLGFGCVLLAASAFARDAAEQPRVLTRVSPVPFALDPNFQFRKTKLYFMSEKTLTSDKSKAGKEGQSGASKVSSKSSSVVQDASIYFERQYRLFGAVTKLDQHQRFGDYFDFFWRTKSPADVTVRLEYRQEKLHEHVQAQEIACSNPRGTQKTEFRVVGDDYFDNGRVMAWRCLLIAEGHVVAETRSFLWR